jgi:Uma2 family endonuclease
MPNFIIATKEDTILYPDTDGKPIAENTIQYEWITLIRGNLDIIFAPREDVFIAADLFWYAVEGNPKARVAPDVMVAFDRPKGDRYSYMQWKEDGIAPQVVFEILSPGNLATEMRNKFKFYDRHGVEEYYLYDPDTDTLDGWRRDDESLADIPKMDGWVSPRLGICFDHSSGKLVLRDPDGQRFRGMRELSDLRREAEKKAEQENRRADREATRSDRESTRADRAEAKAVDQQARVERMEEVLKAAGLSLPE